MKTRLSALLTLAIALCAAAAVSCSQREEERVAGPDNPMPPPEPPEDLEVTHLDVEGAADLLSEDKEIIILDVRTPAEFAQGHLEGAVNIDYRSADFAERVLSELYRDKPYLLHCQSGGRSSAAAEQLIELGFFNLYHLDGGYSAWEKAGKPVEN